jgi:hypothetical protein
MSFEKQSIDFIGKLVTQESKVFFEYLKSNGLIEKNQLFDDLYNKYKESGFGRDNPEYNIEYTALSKQLEKLNRDKNIKGYHIFSRQHRPLLKTMYPDLKPVEITRKISELWRKLATDAKIKYKSN